MMERLGLNHHQHNSSYLYTMVGFTSSLFHDFILTPTEAIKQRLQLYRSDRLNVRAFDVIRRMIRNEGLKSFYRSFGVNYFMNVPYGALIVTINEKLKETLMRPDKEYSLLNYFAFAGMAGLLAAVPTCPLDVIKTKLNTQNCMSKSCGMDPKACSVLRGNVQTYQNKVSAYHSYGTVS
jgi:solute carrier family 25 iron transporter 28/37